MAITINGTGSITGLTAGGLPDGSVVASDLAPGAITTGALPAGSILQMVMVETSTPSAPTTATTILTNTITTKASSTDSDIYVIGNVCHGLGPRATNLDPYGLILRIRENGSNMSYYRADVFAGSGTGVTYGPEWDVRSLNISAVSGATWSAGDSISYTILAAPDGSDSYCLINRPNDGSTSHGISYLLVMEVAK